MADATCGDMHAWAEVYLPGTGWRGFDPSRGLSVKGDCVAVAAGRLSRDAAPTLGKFRGEAISSMHADILVSVLESSTSTLYQSP
ncbi:MAG TPA: transglutaminase family protein [Gallionella sp.]|nr:transglutaminase family protein [Gallionella sp.]